MKKKIILLFFFIIVFGVLIILFYKYSVYKEQYSYLNNFNTIIEIENLYNQCVVSNQMLTSDSFLECAKENNKKLLSEIITTYPTSINYNKDSVIFIIDMTLKKDILRYFLNSEKNIYTLKLNIERKEMVLTNNTAFLKLLNTIIANYNYPENYFIYDSIIEVKLILNASEEIVLEPFCEIDSIALDYISIISDSLENKKY